jgi:membrane protease YdiL (CAAX protease family)
MKLFQIYIITYTILATIGLYLIESLIHPTYGYLLILKVTFFLLVPLGIWYFSKKSIWKFWKWSPDTWKFGIGFGLLSMVVIALTYILLRDSIDWGAIGASMEARRISMRRHFSSYFLYIMFGNSLLEEYFFRGIVFRQMLLNLSKSEPILLSALMFSLYHMTIFQSWFRGWILALALFGLFLWGIFFAWLYEKTWGIWSAWIFHIFADFMILIIGYSVFFL